MMILNVISPKLYFLNVKGGKERDELHSLDNATQARSRYVKNAVLVFDNT